jgi:hypothetical protein
LALSGVAIVVASIVFGYLLGVLHRKIGTNVCLIILRLLLDILGIERVPQLLPGTGIFALKLRSVKPQSCLVHLPKFKHNKHQSTLNYTISDQLSIYFVTQVRFASIFDQLCAYVLVNL